MDSKMKTLIGGMLFLAAGVVLLLQGCSSQVAPLTAMVVPNPGAAALPSNYIDNFENDSIYVNIDLLGYPSTSGASVSLLVPGGSSSGGSSSSFNPGFWSANTYGGPAAAPNTINHPFVMANSVPDGTDSSNFAIHIGWASTPVTCIAVGGYEADQLTCTLENSATTPYYDASPFLNSGNGGVAFYYNIMPDDTTTYRQFQVATQNTTGAFNHFHYLLPNGSSSGWKAVTVTWNQLTYPGFGPNSGALTTTGPTTVAGTVYPGNLTHVAFLQWQWSDNVAGSAGAPVTNFSDFWIDNVQFIP